MDRLFVIIFFLFTCKAEDRVALKLWFVFMKVLFVSTEYLLDTILNGLLNTDNVCKIMALIYDVTLLV